MKLTLDFSRLNTWLEETTFKIFFSQQSSLMSELCPPPFHEHRGRAHATGSFEPPTHSWPKMLGLIWRGLGRVSIPFFLWPKKVEHTGTWQVYFVIVQMKPVSVKWCYMNPWSPGALAFVTVCLEVEENPWTGLMLSRKLASCLLQWFWLHPLCRNISINILI